MADQLLTPSAPIGLTNLAHEVENTRGHWYRPGMGVSPTSIGHAQGVSYLRAFPPCRQRSEPVSRIGQAGACAGVFFEDAQDREYLSPSATLMNPAADGRGAPCGPGVPRVDLSGLETVRLPVSLRWPPPVPRPHPYLSRMGGRQSVSHDIMRVGFPSTLMDLETRFDGHRGVRFRRTDT